MEKNNRRSLAGVTVWKNVKCDASHFVFMACLSAVLVSGCGLIGGSGGEGKRPVARAYDRYLYVEDVASIIPAGTTLADSLKLTENYIDNWIRQQVVLYKAERNLPDQLKRVEKQLKDYRNSLITFAYEQELIRQQLDTVVEDSEIKAYYEAHPANFELRDHIVKALYARVKSDSPKLDELKKWFRSDGDTYRNEIDEYCHQFATDFILDDESWMRFDDLLKKVPLEAGDKGRFLRHNKFVELADSNDVHLVRLSGHRLKGDLSPLDFERNNIRGMIINKRKLSLIRAMEKSAYDQAYRNSDFEIFSEEDEGN